MICQIRAQSNSLVIVNFQSAAVALRQKAKELKTKKVIIGFDGTVDKIVAVVDKRLGIGENFQKVGTIDQLSDRVRAAAGKSTNIELYLKEQKIGGNAAIMAGALAAGGVKTTLVADLGKPRINPVFEALSKKATLKSLGEPTETHALEFGDGKVMLCYTRNHEAITFENIEKVLGGRGGLKSTLEQSNLMALVNWTMIPAMTGIFKRLLGEVLPGCKASDGLVFFDLADPEKRPVAELKEALELIGKFSQYKKIVLGLNLKEAQQVAAVLGLGSVGEREEEVKQAAKKIREKLGIAYLAIHLTESAGCSTQRGENCVYGPHIETPRIKTGAGDHFNAGLAAGLMLGVDDETTLTLAVAYSGFYVAQGHSPTFEEALSLIEKGW